MGSGGRSERLVWAHHVVIKGRTRSIIMFLGSAARGAAGVGRIQVRMSLEVVDVPRAEADQTCLPLGGRFTSYAGVRLLIGAMKLQIL